MATIQSSGAQKHRTYIIEVGAINSSTHYIIDSSKDGLQIVFDISKTSDHKHNRGNAGYIDIYNLPQEITDAFEDDNVFISLSVGYEGRDQRTLLHGNSKSCSTRKEGNDIITRVEVGEGYVDLHQVKLSDMVSAGKTVGDVIEVIRSQMPNTSKGSYQGEALSKPIVCGHRLSGTPREALKKLCEANRLEYNINAGVLNVSDVNGLSRKDKNTCPFITPNTGLIDLPFRTTDEPAKTAKDKRRRYGVQFACLLNPDLSPGSLVYLESPTITGFYRVNTVRFSGSFRTNEWKSECQCSEVTSAELA